MDREWRVRGRSYSSLAIPESFHPTGNGGEMQAPEIRTKIKQIIGQVAGLDPAKIGDHATLRDELNLDSLSLLEIGVDVDYAFKLGLPDERYREVQSLDEMVDLVLGQLAGAAVAEETEVRLEMV
jgi:acyl carrier protein